MIRSNKWWVRAVKCIRSPNEATLAEGHLLLVFWPLCPYISPRSIPSAHVVWQCCHLLIVEVSRLAVANARELDAPALAAVGVGCATCVFPVYSAPTRAGAACPVVKQPNVARARENREPITRCANCDIFLFLLRHV